MKKFIIFEGPSVADPAFVNVMVDVTNGNNPEEGIESVTYVDFEYLKDLIKRIESKDSFKVAARDKEGRKHPLSPMRNE